MMEGNVEPHSEANNEERKCYPEFMSHRGQAEYIGMRLFKAGCYTCSQIVFFNDLITLTPGQVAGLTI